MTWNKKIERRIGELTVDAVDEGLITKEEGSSINGKINALLFKPKNGKFNETDFQSLIRRHKFQRVWPIARGKMSGSGGNGKSKQ